MFYFPDETEVQKEIDKDLIFKTFNKGKSTSDADLVDGVEIENIVDSSTTNLKASEDYPLIYNIWIWVKDRVIPAEFLKVLDKQMDLPVVYQIITSSDGDRISILPVKKFKNNHFEVIRVLSSGWFLESDALTSNKEFKTIEDAYKTMIEFMTFQEFNENETIPDYIKRVCDDFNSGDKAVIENNGLVEESVQSVNKGYRDYSSIRNTIRVYTPLKIQRLKIRSFAYRERERITFSDEGLIFKSPDFKNVKGRVVFDKPYYNTLFPETIPVEYALKKAKQLYEKIDELKQSTYVNKEQLKSLYEEVTVYENIVMRETSLFSRIEIEGFVDGKTEIESWQDMELERMLVEGCTIKHYTFGQFEIYDFSEIKHRTEKDEEPEKEYRVRKKKTNPKPEKRQLTAEDIAEMKKYSSKKIDY